MRKAILAVGALCALSACGGAETDNNDEFDEFVNAATGGSDGIGAGGGGIGTTSGGEEASFCEGRGEEEGSYLKKPNGFGEDMVRTAMSLTTHQKWVSLIEGDIAPTLKAAGWELVPDSTGQEVFNGGLVSGAQAYVAVDTCEKRVVLAVRGSFPSDCSIGGHWPTCVHELASNVVTDLAFGRKRMEYVKTEKTLEAHGGFVDEWGKLRDEAIERLEEYPDHTVYVTGFSLGAGVATLAAIDIKLTLQRVPYLYTGGSPRVGGADWLKTFDGVVPNTFRIAVNKDPITLIPSYQPIIDTNDVVGKLLDGVAKSLLDDWDHVGGLLHLGPAGQVLDEPVVKLVNTKVSHHSYDVYWDALKAYRDSCLTTGSWGCTHNITQAAEYEREKNHAL